MTIPINQPGNDREIVSAKACNHDILASSPKSSEHAEQDYSLALTEEELALEKKIRRKLDLMIMPLMIWTYLMNYIDRSVLHLSQYTMSWLTSTQKQLCSGSSSRS